MIMVTLVKMTMREKTMTKRKKISLEKRVRLTVATTQQVKVGRRIGQAKERASQEEITKVEVDQKLKRMKVTKTRIPSRLKLIKY